MGAPDWAGGGKGVGELGDENNDSGSRREKEQIPNTRAELI